jgi:lipid II:glycine glycyltransferase (peptidoglycan interpeptide bridge formation enzyme)
MLNFATSRRNEEFSVTLAPGEVDMDWDHFVASQPGGSTDQSTIFARARGTAGWEPWLLTLKLENAIVGGALILRKHVRGLGSILYVSRGPVCRPGANFVLATCKELDRAMTRLFGIYCVVVPPFHADHLMGQLEQVGWRPKPESLPPSGLIVATLLLDLRQDTLSILKQMRGSTRRDIRRSMESELRVSEEGPEAIGRFFWLMSQLCKRRGVKPQPASSRTFEQLWRELGPHGYCRMFIGHLHGEDVSGAFALAFGKTFAVTKVGWSGAHEKTRPNHRIWWECILWAKEHGFETFDFVQILPHHAQALLRGETVHDHYWGVTMFKAGFGGALAFSPPPLYSVRHPLLRPLFYLGGQRIVKSSWLHKIARRLHRRTFDDA